MVLILPINWSEKNHAKRIRIKLKCNAWLCEKWCHIAYSLQFRVSNSFTVARTCLGSPKWYVQELVNCGAVDPSQIHENQTRFSQASLREPLWEAALEFLLNLNPCSWGNHLNMSFHCFKVVQSYCPKHSRLCCLAKRLCGFRMLMLYLDWVLHSTWLCSDFVCIFWCLVLVFQQIKLQL